MPNYSVEHQVSHLKQRYNWDCGVTCVTMLLSGDDRRYMMEHLDEVCEAEEFGHSTWTIDLCYLLKKFKIRHEMYTIMLGINESYIRHDYYSKIIDLDRDRVRKRFGLASSEGIKVSLGTLSMDEIIEHLTKQGPVILLVDAGLLSCDLCKYNKLMAEVRRWFGGSYRGHYILLTGYLRGRILFKDPSREATVCAGPAWRIDLARTASGTDQDCILVFNKS